MFWLLLLLLPGLAAAEVYRWVDESGTVHYGDRPPSGADRVKVPARTVPMRSPDRGATEAREPPPPAVPEVRVRQPRPEQTFHDPRGLVPVSVGLSGDPGQAWRLRYYLDGRPVGEPTRRTEMQLDSVVRGEHRLSVALLYGDDEVTRSDAVTFYMQPPSAQSSGDDGTGAPSAPGSGASPGVPMAPRPGTGGSSP